MKSTLDIIDLIYQVLNSSVLKDAVNGSIYKLNGRPVNSQKEDVIINSLPVSGDQIQRSTVNVNIYVPDIKLTISGKSQYQPNFARLKTLANTATEILQSGEGDIYNYWLGNQTVLSEPEISQHFVNIRVEFKNHNT